MLARLRFFRSLPPNLWARLPDTLFCLSDRLNTECVYRFEGASRKAHISVVTRSANLLGAMANWASRWIGPFALSNRWCIVRAIVSLLAPASRSAP